MILIRPNTPNEEYSSVLLDTKVEKVLAIAEPALDKIQKAIEEVAKENGYNFIINSGQPEVGLHIILYADEKDNISNLVLKKLGIEPPPPAPEEN